jgi:hypothetical protein
MLKETIKYTDYEGNEREEDFYFNLNKAELMEMQLSTEGGLEKRIQKIISSQNGKEIIELFKAIILKAYGEKSDDGKRFIKNQEIRDSFEQSEAYSELFMKLATDADAATKFINGVIPKDVAGQVKETPATIAAINNK